ncbi:OsmC family protein [Bordetella genomosp. 11]|uniref:Peroxiredoxin n=1 Tax=Bordetella genomosp. 11 TaxID=1416808 RepID=A0A261UZQ0_9BORD|nr:OsmC family protein [Bordetella genomosp. 11]OZI67071.1 peroxiredoxin [Bordetella genomosp. 11]
MAHGEHKYHVEVRWTGNRGSGTSGYGAYGRDHVIRADGKPDIPGSSDPAFRGDAARWNPEDLLVASASACHKLWYLHLCADAGIVVVDYADAAEGTMKESDGTGRFTGIVLRPRVAIRQGCDPAEAQRLHHVAHAKCYIANSVDFPIACEPTIVVADS